MICEVCLDSLEGPILDLGFHPLCDDLIAVGQNVSTQTYHQEIQLCIKCDTAHQLHQVVKEKLFKPDYHYRAKLTKDVLDGMEGLVDQVAKIINLDKKNIVLDVGCNDGSLLGKFKEKIDCITVGVDPTDAIKDAGTTIDFAVQGFFNSEIAHNIANEIGTPDVITFTNVFAHIEDLPSLIKAIKSLVGSSTILVIENHDLGAVLRNSQFDTFYHEHPRTYSAKSFEFIANQLGMEILSMEFPSRYGGNIRVILGSKMGGESLSISETMESQARDIQQNFLKLQKFFSDWKSESRARFNELQLRGPIYGKALPGRAVMLISSLGITSNEMPIIFEQDKSPKVGFYVPGTLIEVKGDLELGQIKPEVVIVWAWHIIEEVCNYLESLDFVGEVWTPMPRFEMYRSFNLPQ